MDHPQIILAGCFSNRTNGKIFIPNEPLYDLSNPKFDGEGDTSIIRYASIFLKFFRNYEIDCENVSCVIFYLTLEGQVNQWCHTLPLTSVHSFENFNNEIHLALDNYDYWDVLKRMD